MEVDMTIFLKNIKRLADERGLALQDLEQMVGLSKGYFSRPQDGKKGGLGIVYVIKTAQILETSVNYLLYNESADNNQKKIITFISKVIEDSKQGDVVWKGGDIWDDFFIETFAGEVFDVYCYEADEQCMKATNMANYRTQVLCSWRDEEEYELPNIYYDRQFETNSGIVLLKKNYYYGKTQNGTGFLLLNVEERQENAIQGWDIYMIVEEEVIADDCYEYLGWKRNAVGIYHTNMQKNKAIMKETQDLIQCIEQCRNSTYISLKAKTLLDKYLQLN